MVNCVRSFFGFLLWWLQLLPTQGAMVLPTDGTNTDSFSRTALIAAANAAPTYDEEGNLTQDSLWKYTWDGQNRLIQMESASGVPAAQPRVKLKFTYDAQSRRIRKQVWQEVTVNTVKTYALKSDRRFLYDGWNLIAEIDPDGSLARTYLWGTDISGSGQGAGGVGGLLAVRILKGPAAAIGVHFPSYDANGNIIALTSASTGAETACYSYDAFGQELRASGPAAQANPFHFSTKFTDEETGLVYYGYRYLDPRAGRWLNRDRLKERGGLNVYVPLANDVVNDTDNLGNYRNRRDNPNYRTWGDNPYVWVDDETGQVFQNEDGDDPSSAPADWSEYWKTVRTSSPSIWNSYSWTHSADGGFMDQTAYFETRWKGWVTEMKNRIVRRMQNEISTAICRNKYPNWIALVTDNNNLDFNQQIWRDSPDTNGIEPSNETQFGDAPQGIWEKHVTLNRFWFRSRNPRIQVDKKTTNTSYFSWSVDLYVTDFVGFDEDDPIGKFLTYPFPRQTLERARWTIEGKGWVYCKGTAVASQNGVCKTTN